LPRNEWADRVAAKRSHFWLYGWSCETRDAGDALDALIHSPTPGGRGKNNYQGIADPELDRLIDRAAAATEAWERNSLFARALSRVAALRLVVPLEIQPESLVVRRSLAWEPPLNFGLRLFENARPAGAK